MRASLIFAVVLLLTPGLAWADEPATADAAPASQTVAADGPVLEGGGCLLPDLAGLSADDAKTALEGAGFGISPVETALPKCPVRFSCSSIVNCGIGGLCVAADIGPCCLASSGLGVCCLDGTIKVRSCPCVCTGNPCNITCPNSRDVQWNCS